MSNAVLLIDLGRCKYFLPLLSKKGLYRIRDATGDHTYDNLLLEYQVVIEVR